MSENIEKLLEEINLYLEGEFIDKYYVIDLQDYETFNSIYNRLEKNIECERDSEQSSLNEKEAHVLYIYKNLLVELVALFDNDSYTLNIFEEEN